MSRTPYAAEQFLAEMTEINSRTTMEPVGEPDGLGVYRVFQFDKTSSKTLAKALSVLDDQRVVSYEEKDGHLQVTFSHRTLADSRDRFALEAAKTVADGGSTETGD